MSYKFVQDAKFYFNLYERNRETENLDKAAEYLLEAIRLSRSLDYRIELASLYSEMGQLDMSNEECYFVLSKDHKNSECLNILSNNYTEKKNYRAAYYYFSKFDTFGLDELTDIMAIENTSGDFNRLGFRLVWSNGVKDCTDIKEEAEIYLAMKSYKEAIKVLNRIAENSPQYIWARKMLVYCYYMTGDYEQALQITNELLEKNQEDISMLSVAYNILVETNENEKANKLINKIITSECKDVTDALKAGYCLMDSKRYTDAVSLIEREMLNFQYDEGLMLILSSAYYLIGNTEKAKNILLRLINMYGDRTFARFFLESLNAGELNDAGIAYGIPVSRALKLNSLIERNIKSSDKFAKAFLYDSKFKSILKWRILTDSIDDLSYMIICELGYQKNTAALKFLEELLLRDKVSGEAKVNIMSQIIMMGGRRRIAFVYDSYFRIVNNVSIKDATQWFIDAYSMCCVYLSPMLKDYEDEIYNSYIVLNEVLKEEKKRMQSPESLAALILYKCKNLDISRDLNILAGLFGANMQTFRKYIKILESKEK